jgi:hypothetical protein
MSNVEQEMSNGQVKIFWTPASARVTTLVYFFEAINVQRSMGNVE